MQSPIQIELKGVPLKTGLRLLLDQIDMSYVVKDGMILIDSKDGLAARFAENGTYQGDPPVPGYGMMPKDGYPKAPQQEQAGGGMIGGGFR